MGAHATRENIAARHRHGVDRIGDRPRLGLSPAKAPWIAAKIVALIVYIALGMIAFRFGRTRRIRGIAFALALLTFGYIVTVAISKDPRGMLAWLT